MVARLNKRLRALPVDEPRLYLSVTASILLPLLIVLFFAFK